jgi:hypothetical protein
MTWTSFHHRGEVLRDVIAAAEERRDGLLPMQVPGLADRVAQTFGDELTLLGALQLHWHTRLAGRIERELMRLPSDPETAVAVAWRETAGDLPGVRAVIEHYRDHPLDDRMARATAIAAAKERAMLAALAGTASTRVPDNAA